MSEIDNTKLTEVLFQDHRFEIVPATLGDEVGIGEAHLQSWLETYPNEKYGVTEEWIKNEFGFLIKDGVAANGIDNGIPYRRKMIEKLDSNTLYEVVKDENGTIQGFMYAYKQNEVVDLGAIYLTNVLKGTGVAYKLMDQAVAFAGSLPIKLQVIAYNERAIAFYEKYGFKKGAIEKELFHDKMPVLNMKREASNE